VKIAWGTRSSDSLMALVVYPASPNSRAKAPVVVVVHEIFGLSTWVRGVADQVAADGFIAVAPDMLSRVRGGPTSVELASDTARKLIAGVNAAERNKAINAAANYAMMQPSAAQRYAVIGYCWAGQTRFYHAINGGVKGFSAGVAFYGLPYTSSGNRHATAAVPSSVIADSLAKIKVPCCSMARQTRTGRDAGARVGHEVLGKAGQLCGPGFEADARARRRGRQSRGHQGRLAQDDRLPEEEPRREVAESGAALAASPTGAP
jgi:dienelactone hydrolase